MKNALILAAFTLSQTAFADMLVLDQLLGDKEKAKSRSAIEVTAQPEQKQKKVTQEQEQEQEQSVTPAEAPVKNVQSQSAKAKAKADTTKTVDAKAKPAYPACTSNAKEAEAMTRDKLNRDIMGSVWREERPLVGGKGYMKLVNAGGQLQTYMYSAKGELKGKAPTQLCATKSGVEARLQRSALKFGLLVDTALNSHLAAYQNGDTSVMKLAIKPHPQGMYIHDMAPPGSRKLDGPWALAPAGSVR